MVVIIKNIITLLDDIYGSLKLNINNMFSYIKKIFTFVNKTKKTEVSRPTECERIDYEDPHKQELAVLKILALHESMQSRDIDKIYPSGGRRLNDLLHKGLVDNISNNNRFMYKINEKGLKLIK